MQNNEKCWSKEDYEEVLRHVSDRLWTFVQNNAELKYFDNTIINALNISVKDLNLLLQIHFLLDNRISRFLNTAEKKIIKRLSKNSIRSREIRRYLGRGKVDINGTIRLQASAGGDPTIFSVWNRYSNFDLPENQLFKFLLNTIINLSKDITGRQFEDIGISSSKNIRWTDRIENTALKSYSLLKNVYLRQVKDIYDINEILIEKAERARGRWYDDLVDAARLYYRIFKGEESTHFLYKALQERFLKPLDWNVLYELYVLFEVLNVLESLGWNLQRNSLIGNNNKTVSIYEKKESTISVYYQHIPHKMKTNSIYGDLLDSYGFNNSVRRPDIVIELLDGQSKYYLIVEVKRSTSKQYLVDGIYKVMGYLKDFEKCINGGIMNISGMLVGWSGINDSIVDDNKFDIILSTKDNFGCKLKSILKDII